MKITGIIAEYNPFHKGHQYQISQVRKRFGCDYIIAVISGDFVQRGAPALLDKYTRAHMALLGGADLVLELPAVYATASAEGFAAGGIRTLAATGITDSVSFGMEQDDTDTLMQLADLLTKEPAWYCRRLRDMPISWPPPTIFSPWNTPGQPRHTPQSSHCFPSADWAAAITRRSCPGPWPAPGRSGPS